LRPPDNSCPPETTAAPRLPVETGGWLPGHRLADLDLAQRGILVLGITRANGSYIGAPTGRTPSWRATA
jgi:hypothetical protein